MATSNFIADVIIKKYEHHLPLYRQSKILERNGANIPDNTLGNWVMRAGAALEPLATAMWKLLPHIHVLQMDETPVKVLKPEQKGWRWVYHSCDKDRRFVLFEFSLSRSASVPNARLKGFKGKLQTDGYSGYNTLRKNDQILNFGCWDHARRNFTDAIKVNNANKKGIAGKIFKLIRKLYAIERQCKGESDEKRSAYRMLHAQPILDLIFLQAEAANVLPKSKVGEALRYLLNQKESLLLYVFHGDVEISNIWAENQIRPMALGKKNWLFVGNEHSASKSALLYSLIQSCRMNKINPIRYLAYVIDQAHKMRRKEVDPESLLPHRIDQKLLL